MAIFGPKPWVNPFWKNVYCSTFWTSCFYSLERRFSTLEYCKRLFSGLYCLKINVEKMAIFEPKPLVNPFGKMSIFFTFWTFCFHSLERLFSNLEYRKRHFSGLYCLKKKVERMAIFGPKPWVNPFGKMSIFRSFDLRVFIAWKGVFLL